MLPSEQKVTGIILLLTGVFSKITEIGLECIIFGI